VAHKAFVAGYRTDHTLEPIQHITATFAVLDSAASALVRAPDGAHHSEVEVSIVYSDTPQTIHNKVRSAIRKLFADPTLTVVFLDGGGLNGG